MTAKQYRKKPVMIDAMRLTSDNTDEVVAWCGGKRGLNPGVLIDTLEGIMKANVGDFVIRGVSGEFYPCKPDIFLATYDAV